MGLGAGEEETDPEGIKRLANDLHWLQCVLWEMETGSRPLPLTLSDDTLQLTAATSHTDFMLFIVIYSFTVIFCCQTVRAAGFKPQVVFPVNIMFTEDAQQHIT